MALSAPISDDLECSICMERYDRQIHVPKLLPCEHSFCMVRLDTLSKEFTRPYKIFGLIASTKTVKDVECPTCRAKHSVPSRGFPTIRALLDIVDQM